MYRGHNCNSFSFPRIKIDVIGSQLIDIDQCIDYIPVRPIFKMV